MTRPPFDPNRRRALFDQVEHAAAADPGGSARRGAHAAGDGPPLTVSRLGDLIRRLLEDGVPGPLRVVGEIANLTERTHVYFSLRDESASISCVLFASDARRTRFSAANGHRVIVTGTLTHYGAQGRTQIQVRRVDPDGAGDLAARFEALCRELRALGWFDDARKRPLPILPQRVAVITSPTGAALHDVRATALARCPAVGLVLVPVRVQGDGAADEIARALRFVSRRAAALGIDAVLLTRGGGSAEDLWTFNDRRIAEAIRASGVPVVAAIGHESDTTIAELVADRRASTPTQATMMLVPDRAELEVQLGHMASRLRALVRARVESARWRLARNAAAEFLRAPGLRVARLRAAVDRGERDLARAVAGRLSAASIRLERLAGRLTRIRPAVVVGVRHERVGALGQRLVSACHRRLERARAAIRFASPRLSDAVRRGLHQRRSRLVAQEAVLRLLDPQRILRLGFVRVERADLTPVTRASALATGERVALLFVDGRRCATIDASGGSSAGPGDDPPMGPSDDHPGDPPAAARRPTRGTARRRPAASSGLFEDATPRPDDPAPAAGT
ncbi:MAG: exodeoxyribonuclease VII large subunit [Phycisphaeraceae bacterium]|nr:exodeoxyribonuclease VII large subunit [Phycisphaeraceae bacterium]